MIDRIMARFGYVPQVELQMADDTLREQRQAHQETIERATRLSKAKERLREDNERLQHQLDSALAELHKVRPPVTAQQLRALSLEAATIVQQGGNG